MGSLSPENSAVYIQGDFSEPMSTQHNFASQYDLEDPSRAMSASAYARIMHQHTKQQLEMASSSARRRSQGNPITLAHETSISSVSSTSS